MSSLAVQKLDEKAQRTRRVVALVGTPNVGKSVIFNALTGGRAWVGNWPGVTVEKKLGRLRLDGAEVEVVDLPGIYGLSAHSIDELIARNFIVEESPDVIVCIVNAANIERGLHLALSLLEMGANIIVDVNMTDIARSHGFEVDCSKLRELLKVPVVATVAVQGIGLDGLKSSIRNSLRKGIRYVDVVDYGAEVEEALEELAASIQEHLPELCAKYPARWIALKLLEEDADVIGKVKLLKEYSPVLALASKLKEKLQRRVGDVDVYITKQRYARAHEIASQCIKRVERVKVTLTEILDGVLINRVLGIPIALSAIFLLFRFAFDVSAPIVDALDVLFSSWLHDLAASAPLPEWLCSLLADGIVAGVGAVMVFLPVIVFFFLGFAILEDVGYMARVSFLVDRVFSKFKLPGRAVIPLIIGFGCNVPAVMAARPIEDENERKAAALIAPLASCSARLPVYLVIAGALFGAYAGSAILSMYVLGVALALLVGLALRHFLFRGPSIGFIMELPPYLAPRLKSVAIKTWDRTKRFLIKAGTVILAAMILVWVLSVTGPVGYIGPQALESPELLESSWVGILGHGLERIFAPMGWDWKACAALLFGFVAKEIVVGTMAVLHGVSEEALVSPQGPVAASFTPVSAYAYMAFVLIYVPCLATLAMIRSEIGAKYAALALVYEVVLAYIVALLIVGLGSLFA